MPEPVIPLAFPSTECANCGQGRHVFGIFCFPVQFWITAVLLGGGYLALVVFMIWLAVTHA